MFGSFPIRMNYTTLPKDTTSYTPVDVYEFTVLNNDQAVALCWFIKDRDWMVVDIEYLVPIPSKQLNE